MQKPVGYDETRASGEFTPVNLGGHYCVIKQVTERQTSTGKDQIVVLFDFAPEDSQKNYFSTLFNNNDREEKKWPFNGSKYITVQDYNDPSKTSRAFKTFCSCVEKSNGYTIQWGGNNWGQQFKGKKIGAIYGEEEHEYNGEVSMRRIPRWFCNIDSVESARIPDAIYLDKAPAATSSIDMIPVPSIAEGVDEEIPF